MLGKGKNSSYSDDGREKVCTLIGQGTTFDGDLTSAETIRIDGVINGNCSCEKKLILSAEGQVKGNITAQSVIISVILPYRVNLNCCQPVRLPATLWQDPS